MKTLQLSVKNNKAYYLTSIKEKHKEILFNIKKEKISNIDRNILFENLSLKWGINCNGILKIGETEEIKSSALASYIDFFKGKDIAGIGSVGFNREIHYRNYQKTVEKQKEGCWLVIECADTRVSVRSALSLMNEKWTILWEVDINTSFEKKMNKRLKNKICYIESF